MVSRKLTDNRDQILDEIIGRGNDRQFLLQGMSFQKNCELRLFIRITGVKGKVLRICSDEAEADIVVAIDGIEVVLPRTADERKLTL